jgi:predicted AAA+ superfamily ATPase
VAISNHERVGKAMEILKDGLSPFVERELKAHHAQRWFEEAKTAVSEMQTSFLGTAAAPKWDVASLLAVMWNQWNVVFRKTLGQAERTLVSELRDARKRWAHQDPISGDDAYRILDSANRLLNSVSAPESDELEKMKTELLRVRFDEQVRSEKRRSAGTAIESQAVGNLTPWREVVNPHKDVASGRYQQAEFAADLWQVHLGEGTDEYRKPAEFFRRTYLTESLKSLLVGAARRLSGEGGDPVVQLQTNFGGGKTHSMLALYHLFSGTPPSELLGVDAVVKEAGVAKLPAVKRVVLVGNKISPGNPVKKPDGTVVRTLWGELAWQLGFATGGAKEAKKAYQRVAADDEKATSPGDVLRELMNEYGPCLILIDEWVAYARQLHDQSDLPAGSFETHFSFAQVLTESAKAAKQCLLVVSLPASDTSGSPHAVADDVEVGGERGRQALERLRNAVGRVEASWRPASAEEGFEIVRRRLFEPLVEKTQFVARDTVSRAFFDLYRTQHQEFPPECRDSDYENRLKAAYPIHPEVFDRLYNDWSTLVKFQRTRGVLRLMAAVIHSLWQKGDKNPLILPANISIDDPRVQFELTRYLSDNWVPVIEKDVDGPNALPLRLDGEVPNLGKYQACRRVARTIYLGSAPTATAAHRGIEDRRVKLGCVMPGESPSVFGDALRRLASTATYLYQDGPRYWYSTQPTVTKLAEDRAEQLKRDSDQVVKELETRIREDVTEDRREKVSRKGDFGGIHPLPHSGLDVPDEMDARLVILGVDHPYTKEPGNRAEVQAKAIWESRGNTPRLYRNTLVFLAVDQARLQDLDEAARRFLAWKSIVDDEETLNLDDHQTKQAKNQMASAASVVTARLPEAYQWLLVPAQKTPHSPVEWESVRLSGQEGLAARASKKLRSNDALVVALGVSVLRKYLDDTLWGGNHVSIRQLAEYFARYLYLPRLTSPAVLINAIRDGLGLITWAQDSFAYADSYDEAAGRYRGLTMSRQVSIADETCPGLLVKPEVAAEQLAKEATAQAFPSGGETSATSQADGSAPVGKAGPAIQPMARVLTRFHGSVHLDPTRLGRDAGKIAEEVVQHLSTLPGAKVELTLEIQATLPSGAPDTTVRIVTENCRTLKFKDTGFEEE